MFRSDTAHLSRLESSCQHAQKRATQYECWPKNGTRLARHSPCRCPPRAKLRVIRQSFLCIRRSGTRILGYGEFSNYNKRWHPAEPHAAQLARPNIHISLSPSRSQSRGETVATSEAELLATRQNLPVGSYCVNASLSNAALVDSPSAACETLAYQNLPFAAQHETYSTSWRQPRVVAASVPCICILACCVTVAVIESFVPMKTNCLVGLARWA